MFSVLFEVHPKPDQWDGYLNNAQMLRPELVEIDGFVDNIRYRSLQREGWILSLSNWRDEKAVVRWRTRMRHHAVQEKGRTEILRDYHLRVGQITHDNQVPEGHQLLEQRLDETQVGTGTHVTLINGERPAEYQGHQQSSDCARLLGVDPHADGMVDWDVFDAVLTPGDFILMVTWRDDAAAEAFENKLNLPESFRTRRVRIVRDYGMFDRREAPQYYPDAEGGKTIHG
jgi:heme-degrading monooxygenase HmoA